MTPSKATQAGQHISNIELPQLNGQHFNLAELKGKRYLLSFYRFASCPFCNLRIHELVQASAQWPSNFTHVAIFDSSLENLQRHTERHEAPFFILADEQNYYYQKFGVERSWLKTLKGGILRIHRVFYAMVLKGYWPTSFGGKLHTMPLDILVNEAGIIEQVHYGQDEGDHLALGKISEFAKMAG